MVWTQETRYTIEWTIPPDAIQARVSPQAWRVLNILNPFFTQQYARGGYGYTCDEVTARLGEWAMPYLEELRWIGVLVSHKRWVW